MSIRFQIAVLIASCIALPAQAQFWAPQTAGVDAAQPQPDQGPQRGKSLGGSGATGPDSIGILPERDTDFDPKTWEGTSFAEVMRLIDLLPDRIDSAAEHELTRNLLVSVATAPQGDDGGDRMLTRRVIKLSALGNVADAAALARAAPGLPSDPALAHAEVEAELLAGQIESACIDLHAFARILTDPASVNGLALCMQRAGEGDAPPMEVESLGILARIAGAPVSADPSRSPPGRLVAAAQDANLGPDQRLAAAFAAGRASAIDGASLAALFGGVPLAPEISAEPGPPTDGVLAAAVFHAIAEESDPERKLTMVEGAVLSPQGVSDKVSVALVAPLREIAANPELGSLAPRFARLFYAIGDVEAATPWAQLADQSGVGAALWPYRVLLKQADPTGIAEWEQQARLDPAKLARVLMILSAFDITVPPGRGARIQGDDLPEPILSDLLAMDQAAKDLKTGETTLRVIAILGRNGPARMHPLALRRALADLDGVHLHGESHALAFEAMTAVLLGH
jgi:hypothetical protein